MFLWFDVSLYTGSSLHAHYWHFCVITARKWGSVFSAVSDFFLFVCLCAKYPGNRWTHLRQIHTEDVFDSLLGRVWMSRSKVNVTGTKSGKLPRSHPHWQCIARRVPYAANDVPQETGPFRGHREVTGWRECTVTGTFGRLRAVYV